jgi:hypothetical protein
MQEKQKSTTYDEESKLQISSGRKQIHAKIDVQKE